MKFDDSNILEDIRNGRDRQAIEIIYQNCFPQVRAHISKNGGDEDEAKDIFQDAIMVFYNKAVRREFDENYKIAAFVFSVCKNMWINRFHRRNRNQDLDSLPGEARDDFDGFAELMSEERSVIILKMFEELGETCKRIMEMVIYHRYSMKEIKEALNFSSENTAKTKHYKCKQRLIKRLKDNKGFEEFLRGV